MILSGVKYIIALITLIGSGLFIFDSIILPIYVGYNNEHYVPDLRGVGKTEAIQTLRSIGYQIEIIPRPFDIKNKPNTVLNISPRQFTKVKKGREIKLTIAGDRKHVKVPNVIGLSERNAIFNIQRNELVVDTTYHEYNTEYLKGYVISQLPDAGDLRLTGYDVTLIISKGNPPDYFIVPDLINLSEKKAIERIIETGFQLGQIIKEYQPNLLNGTIIEQSLTQGMRLAFPARIDIHISTDIESLDTLKNEELE